MNTLADLRDCLNLDSATDAELELLYQSAHFHPRTTAEFLFPDKPGDYVRATRLLGSYSINLLTARNCRREGKIETARTYEAICNDNIYPKLPDYAKW